MSLERPPARCQDSEAFGVAFAREAPVQALQLLADHVQDCVLDEVCGHRSIERFNQTLKREWASAGIYTTNAARTRHLDRWLHHYNHHRTHTAIGGPPMIRVNNAAVCDS